MKKQNIITLIALILISQFFVLASKADAQAVAVLSIPAGTYEAAPGGTFVIPVNIDLSALESAGATVPTDIEWHFTYDTSDIADIDIFSSNPDLFFTPSRGGVPGDYFFDVGNLGTMPLSSGELATFIVKFTSSTINTSTKLNMVTLSAADESPEFPNPAIPVDIVASPVTTTLTITQPVVTIPDTTAPAVDLTAPVADSTVSGSSVSLTASSTDDTAVAGVTFYYDSTNQIGSEITATSSPDTYTAVWDTTSVTDGAHTLIAVSRDTSNNYATSSAISVTVQNTAPVVTPDVSAPAVPAVEHTATPGGHRHSITGGEVLGASTQDLQEQLLALMIQLLHLLQTYQANIH